MSRSLLMLKFSKQLLSLNQISKNSVINRGLRCRTFPCDPCKPTNYVEPFACEKVDRKCSKCSAWDRRRDPNLCSYQLYHGYAPERCRSSDPDVQNIVCMPGIEGKVIEIRKPTYPHRPWPTFRNTPWSPTVYVKVPCACGSCKMLNYGKIPMQLGIGRSVQSCPPLSKSYCSKPPSDPCKPKDDPCKPKPDPCKTKEDPCKPKPDPCQPPKPKSCAPPPCNCCSPPPPPPPPMSTCPPTKDPGCDMNLWAKQASQKTAQGAPPFEGVQLCIDEEALLSKIRIFRMTVLFGLLPLIAICTGIVLENSKAEHNKPRPEYIPYSYMYIRSKRFPWGDGNHGLLHNPERNAVPPTGYEVPDPHAEPGTEE